MMDEDSTHHRRRSSSLVFAAGTKHGNVHPSKQSPANGHIPEESDAAASSSDVEMDNMHTDDEMSDDEETGLTHTQRKKRRRRRRRSTRLDERVVNSEDKAHATEEIARASIVRSYAVNAVLIALWYSFSISISVYNKWMFSKDNLDFHFPLFTTSLHMIVQFVAASLVLYFLPQFRPSAGSADPHEQGYSQVGGSEDSADNSQQNSPRPAESQKESPLMTKWFYITRIGPCGTATALDIGLGNFSLRFISLTFFTMCKSSVLAFVLLFAFLFRLESPSWRLLAIITLMTVGVIMMVAGETAFNALGFILVMSASFCSGFRWSLTQILLLRNPATSNPFSSIFFLTPVMFLALIVLALPIEGPAALAAGFRSLTESKGIAGGIAIMLFPGGLAFLMVAAEFALLKRTSVVTLSVCGIFKEVLTISAAGIVFGDNLTPINISGLVVTIASIAMYNYLKYSKMRRDAEKRAQQILETETDTPAKPLQRYSGENEVGETVGRESTSNLIRDNLAQGAGEVAVPPLINPKVNGSLGHGRSISQSQSPVKRPEDLE